MFHDIPDAIRARMHALELMDTSNRANEMSHFERLRQVPPVTGRFLALAAAAAPAGGFIEIGTSGGYSALWISLACRARNRTLRTFELARPKIELAEETFRVAGVDDIVEIVPGDAVENLNSERDIAFCFLDTEKELYERCYGLVVPNMVSGALLVADNVVSHEDVLKPFIEMVQADGRVDALTLSVGSGVLLARRI